MNNEKLILEALYYLIDNTKVGLDKSDTKEIMKNRIGKVLSQTTDNVNEELPKEKE